MSGAMVGRVFVHGTAEQQLRLSFIVLLRQSSLTPLQSLLNADAKEGTLSLTSVGTVSEDGESARWRSGCGAFTGLTDPSVGHANPGPAPALAQGSMIDGKSFQGKDEAKSKLSLYGYELHSRATSSQKPKSQRPCRRST